VLCKTVLEKSFLLTKIWAHRIFCFNIVKKRTPVVYKTDNIANLHGHEVLKTPDRHCELNPIELIWAQVKGFVDKNNTNFRLKE
jgi:hypothetical protein